MEKEEKSFDAAHIILDGFSETDWKRQRSSERFFRPQNLFSTYTIKLHQHITTAAIPHNLKKKPRLEKRIKWNVVSCIIADYVIWRVFAPMILRFHEENNFLGTKGAQDQKPSHQTETQSQQTIKHFSVV